jgi:predicted DNA-binding helix-hairpin-helix protein
VGGSDESDEEIFRRVVYKYEEMEVRGAYYSAFNPLERTPFEIRAKQPLWREHRLYWIDWLTGFTTLSLKISAWSSLRMAFYSTPIPRSS